MKEDQRMNAKSPDPDDLAGEAPPEPVSRADHHSDRPEKDRGTEPSDDRSAPHVPPVEKGRLRGE